MREKSESDRTSPEDEPWHLYILRCKDGSLYTGIAKNLIERIKKHNSGKGAAYTRAHRPVKLVYSESKRSKSAALKREIGIKGLSKNEKLFLIKSGG